MGSSKKSKDKERDKEHKRKRRHRSRSRSRDRHDRRDKSERKSRREEKKRRRETEQTTFEYDHKTQKPVPVAETKIDPVAAGGGKEKLSLSIEETNKIRAKLGLKPLDTGGASSKGDGDDSKPAKKEDVHVPATNMAEVKKTADLREKMAQMKEKRRINMMLGKVKSLADVDSDDDNALSWVKKSRKMSEEKQKAERQAKMLQEMDEEFGIGDLVDEEFHVKKKYTSKDLTGLKVEHDQVRFAEGRTTILTLQDKGILDEDGDDTLVNVNMQDDERADKYKENKKKKPVYNPYANADDFDDYGILKTKELLGKYDEEIDGMKKDSFQLGRGGKYNAEHEKMMQAMKQDFNSRGVSLALPPPMIAREYYTDTEMHSFKKVTKKVRKIRKKTKAMTADDLLPLGEEYMEDLGSRKQRKKKDIEPEEGELPEEILKSEPIPGLDLVELEMDKHDPFDDMDTRIDYEDLQGVVIEEDSAAMELEMMLKKTRKIRQRKVITSKERDKNLADTLVKEEVEMPNEEPEHKSGQIVLNATSEFCRTLGEIPTYGLAGNRPEEDEELMDFEQDQRRLELDENAPGWQQVEIDTRPVEIKEEEKAVLDDEPIVKDGLAAALDLASKKGYLDKSSKKSVSAPTHKLLEAQNYSIEDKRYEDLDEKSRKRNDRFMGGVVSDFKDKIHYKPNVKLEYMDEGGRMMSPKEAFRYLSHRFHGKGSGMKKTEKRQKKQEEIMLMKNMSSTDTPLGTVALLREKQKIEKTPYVLLSGKPTTSLSK